MYVCMCKCVSVPLSLCLPVSLIESFSVASFFRICFLMIFIGAGKLDLKNV